MTLKRFTAVLIVAFLLVPAIAVPGAVGGAEVGVERPNLSQENVACTFPYETTDGTGAKIQLDSKPQRVVALQPSAAQIMWEIGAQEKVVGMPVGPTTAYLNGSAEKTDVTTKQMRTDIEKVIAQKPDLVLAPNVTPPETVQKLRKAGVTVYKFGIETSIEDIKAHTKTTGRLVGACQGATDRVAKMNETISSIESSVEGKDRPRVLYLMGGGYTAGNGTFINELIKGAGGENIAASANITGYGQISEETVIERDPEWIIIGSNTPQIPNRSAYAETTALTENNTVTVDSNYISQPGPRVTGPMEQLAKAFHPNAFEQEALANDAQTPNNPGEGNGLDLGIVGLAGGAVVLLVAIIVLGRRL